MKRSAQYLVFGFLPSQKEAKRTKDVQSRLNLCGRIYKQTSSSAIACTDINIQLAHLFPADIREVGAIRVTNPKRKTKKNVKKLYF
jgi:hypothetical protein